MDREVFLAGPKSDAKDDAQEQVDNEAGKDGKSIAASKSSNKSGKEDKSVQNAFRPGPKYESKYDADEQLDIYGGKSAVEPPRPLLEIGREQYTSGLYDQSSTLLGGLNPLLPGLAIYGDWRTAVAYNKNNGKDIAQIATRLNLDVDFKFTAHRTHTRLLHADSGGRCKIQPLRVLRRRRRWEVQRRVRPRAADFVFRG